MVRHHYNITKRLLPIGVSVLLNGTLCLVLFHFVLPVSESETRIAVEINPIQPKAISQTTLPPPSPHIIKIKQQAEQIVATQKTTNPPTIKDTIRQLIQQPPEPKPDEMNRPRPEEPQKLDEKPSEIFSATPPLDPIPHHIDDQPNTMAKDSGHSIDDGNTGRGAEPGPSTHSENTGNGNNGGEGGKSSMPAGIPGGNGNTISLGGDIASAANGKGPGASAASQPGDGQTSGHDREANTGGHGTGAQESPKHDSTGDGKGDDAHENGGHGGSRKGSVHQRGSIDRFYPQDARDDGIEGTVTLEVRVGTDGKLKGTPKLVKSSGNRSLDKAAIKAISKAYSFEPAMEDGKPVESTITLEVRFKLN